MTRLQPLSDYIFAHIDAETMTAYVECIVCEVRAQSTPLVFDGTTRVETEWMRQLIELSCPHTDKPLTIDQ